MANCIYCQRETSGDSMKCSDCEQRRQRLGGDSDKHAHRRSSDAMDVVDLTDEDGSIEVPGGGKKGNPEKKKGPDELEKEAKALEKSQEQRKNTSLGSILSGLSAGALGSKAKENPVVVEEVPKKRYNDFGPYGRANKRFHGGGYGSGGGGWGDNSWGQYGYDQYGYNEGYDEDEWQGEEDSEEANERWIAEETISLEQEFGPGVITAQVNEAMGASYFCEICQAPISSRRTLNSHIDGMKHLKRKKFMKEKEKMGKFLNLDLLQGKEKQPSDSEANSDSNQSNPAKEIPSTNPTKEIPPTNPAMGMPPTNYPPGMPPTNYPQGMPPTNPAIGMPPTNYPQGMPPTNYPQGMPPTNYPQGMPPTNYPQGMPPTNQWSTPPPPPPPVEPKVDPVEEKPKVKSSLSGGATGILLKKLAACAVKNLKDCDLATNVIIGLVQTMKEYTHGKGDTRAIEILTEMDVKLKSIRPSLKPPPKESEKSKSQDKTSQKTTSKPPTPAQSPVSSNTPTNAGYSDYSSSNPVPQPQTPIYSTGANAGYNSSSNPVPQAQTPISSTPANAGYNYQQPDYSSYGSSYYSSNNSSAPETQQYPANYSSGYAYASYVPPTAPQNAASRHDTGYSAQYPPPPVNFLNTAAPPPPPPASASYNYGNPQPGKDKRRQNISQPSKTYGLVPYE